MRGKRGQSLEDGADGAEEDGETPLTRTRRGSSSSSSLRGHKQSFEVELASLDPSARAKLVDMWALPNLALLLSYFTIGFAMTFTGTPLTVYIVSGLNVGPAQLNICGTMLALPWSFKVGKRGVWVGG